MTKIEGAERDPDQSDQGSSSEPPDIPPAQPATTTARLLLGGAIALAVLSIGINRIADLDFWWHLKTGQIIAATHTITRTDIYSYTAYGAPYVDHEWLFQLLAWAAWSHGGAAAVALAKCAIVATTLILVALWIVRRGVDPFSAAGLTLLAIAGGIVRMIERPELFSTLFAVLTLVILEWSVEAAPASSSHFRRLLLLPLLTAIWSNIHAALIVGLAIQFLFLAGVLLQRGTHWKSLGLALAASVIAAGANPFGFRVLTVPFELTRIIDSGVINNLEWRHSTPADAPFFFVCLLVVAACLVAFHRRMPFSNFLIAAFLAFIALRYVRNIGLFAMMMPLLIAPGIVAVPRRWRIGIAAAGLASFVIVATIRYPFQRGIGIASYFPDRIARFVVEDDLRGNMLNSYSFGGYLIWTLFPERRVFVDGRNEVYLPLLEKLAPARSDSRAWNKLLADYHVDYALLEYIDDLDRVVTIDRNGRRTESFAPVSTTRFPRSRWALVYWDDDGMVLLRRGGPNPVAAEYDSVFPEGRGYQRALVAGRAVDRNRAIAQLERKLAEDPGCRRARALLRALR